MKRPGATPGLEAAGLPALVTLVMFGLVLCANGDRYGPFAATFGGLLAGAGIWACIRRFRRSGISNRQGELT